MANNLLFVGTVRHRRYLGRLHEFQYKVFMFYFDLEHMGEAFRDAPQVSIEKFNWFYFRRKDYLSHSEIPLNEYVRQLVETKYGEYPLGRIHVLTNLCCLGYNFNPISVYFIFKENSNEIAYLIAEVTNTPWTEKHVYILKDPIHIKEHLYQYNFKKELHVSPFMGMDYDYQLKLKWATDRIVVHMESYHENTKHFDATLTLTKADTSSLKVFVKHPFMTYKVSAAIYWQALLLWLKRTTFHNHPGQGNHE